MSSSERYAMVLIIVALAVVWGGMASLAVTPIFG
jgi:hypothetical protein